MTLFDYFVVGAWVVSGMTFCLFIKDFAHIICTNKKSQETK